MRKLIESSFVSLDGYVNAEKLAPHWSADAKAHALAELDRCDAFLFGRKTYELFAQRWSGTKGDPYLDRVNAMPKYIASTTLKDSDLLWNASLLDSPIAQSIANLKAQPGGNLMKYGTSDLDRVLLEHRLVDEYRFSIFPILLGQGKRLFEGFPTAGLSLRRVDAKTFGNGIVSVTYVPSYAER